MLAQQALASYMEKEALKRESQFWRGDYLNDQESNVE